MLTRAEKATRLIEQAVVPSRECGVSFMLSTGLGSVSNITLRSLDSRIAEAKELLARYRSLGLVGLL
jgi:hypothetical protein